MNRTLLPQPTLLLITGVAASGKTTFSKIILQKLHMTYLDNNFIADAFFPDTRNDSAYLKIKPHLYEILYSITKENLLIGNSVLLDAPHVKEMRDPQWRSFISDMVTTLNAKLVVIRCWCSEQTLRDRIASRGEKRDVWKLHNWQQFMLEQPVQMAIPFDHLDINTENNLAENISSVMDYILSRK